LSHSSKHTLATAAAAALLTIANAAFAQDAKSDGASVEERLSRVESQLNANTSSPTTKSAGDTAYQYGIPGRPVLGFTRSTLWLYGQIDATIGTYSGVPTGNGTYKWQTGSLVGGLNPDKWGILAQHVLDEGSGLKIMGNLEGEFETPTGNEDTPGTIFNRQAWVGFKDDALGQITFGRNNPVAKDFDGIWADPYHENSEVGYGGGGYTNSDNFKYIVWYIGVATGTHADSNIQYKKVMGHWVLGLDYQFGGNQRLDGNASGFGKSFATNSSEQVALAYNGDGYHLSGHYGHVNRDDELLQSFTFGGGIQVGPTLQLNGGLIHYSAGQAAIGKRTDNAFTLSGKLSPGGPMTYELGYVGVKFNNAASNADGAVMIPFLQGTSDGTANLANGAASGKMQTLYGGARYHFDKETQLYLIVDRMQISGDIKMNGWYNGQFGGSGNPKGQTEILAGVSWRF
jgi:predicted porin